LRNYLVVTPDMTTFFSTELSAIVVVMWCWC